MLIEQRISRIHSLNKPALLRLIDDIVSDGQSLVQESYAVGLSPNVAFNIQAKISHRNHQINIVISYVSTLV